MEFRLDFCMSVSVIVHSVIVISSIVIGWVMQEGFPKGNQAESSSSFFSAIFPAIFSVNFSAISSVGSTGSGAGAAPSIIS